MDGEEFDVRRDTDGSLHFDWISGPNPGYGFTTSGDPDAPPADALLIESIRDFLTNVNPTTGYLD